MQVVYFERAELPGRQFFRCDRMRATLSTDACQGMWRKANGDGGDGGEREACLRCPLGAQHAGAIDANLSSLHLAKLCARCHRPASRLINGMVCVSCMNRQYEFLRGRNAKGTIPTMKPLCRRRVRFTAGGEPCSLVVQHSLDTDELVVAALRDNKNRVRFGFGAQVPTSIRQLRLF